MVLGDEALVIWFVLLVSPRGAVKSNDGQGRAVIEAQELELGLEQIELGQAQISDVFLAGIENDACKADSFLVERHELCPGLTSGGHKLGNGVVGLADFAGDLASGLREALAGGNGLGASLGAAGLTPVEKRQRQHHGRA